MNKLYIYFGLCATLLFSCHDNIEENISQKLNESSTTTRSINSWNTCSECILRSGETKTLPWANSSSAIIPDDIRTDINEEDGWRILYTNVSFIGYDTNVTKADKGVNYMLLYNIYSGILKGFLYIENNVSPNNNAYWLLSTDSKTKLFNFVPYFAEAIDSQNAPQTVSLSTISRNGITQGFEQGWNCFLVELAYDENSINEKFFIGGYSLNESKITFQGSYNSSSNGTIVSTTQNTSSIIEGLASGFGEGGKGWIKAEQGKSIKFGQSVIQGVLDKGMSGFVSSGLYKIFGSLLGTTKTTSELQFTTNGKIKIEGKSTTPASGLIKPLTGIPLNSLNQNLGVWNLESAPIYTAKAYSELQKMISSGTNKTAYFYKLNFSPSLVIKKNPANNTSFDYTLGIVRYNLYNGKVPFFFNRYPANYIEPAVRETQPPILYEDSTCIIRDNETSYNIYVTNLLPNKTSSNNKPAIDFTIPGVNIRESIVFRVLTKNSHSGIDTYSSKSFIPIHKFDNQSARPYNWTYQQLKNIGY